MFCKNFDDIRNKLLKMGVVTAPSYKHFSSLFISAASVVVGIVSRLEPNPQTMADDRGGKNNNFNKKKPQTGPGSYHGDGDYKRFLQNQ